MEKGGKKKGLRVCVCVCEWEYFSLWFSKNKKWQIYDFRYYKSVQNIWKVKSGLGFLIDLNMNSVFRK